MKPTYICNDNIITSLGFSTSDNMEAMSQGTTGIRLVDDPVLYPKPWPLSKIDTDRLNERFGEVHSQYRKASPSSAFTRLEKMLILSIHDVLSSGNIDPANPRTLLILSTTKGNIDLLEDRLMTLFSHKRLYLWELGDVIAGYFRFRNQPLIISNACISGVLALMTAHRYLNAGLYDDVVVSGGDIATEFVISGFMSFQALSPVACKPFDASRNGLSLGEGAGTIHLSVRRPESGSPVITIAGCATTNDANHISGPSRTGEELALAISRSLAEADLEPSSVDYIAAHGTATIFNDEMEAKAVNLAGLRDVPVSSHKGYWGHTLGAAGIIESVATVAAMKQNLLIRSLGFDNLGVPDPIHVIRENQAKELTASLKTASGFGGCNAALVFKKN